MLTADAVENFLRQNEIPLQSEKGGMCRLIGFPCRAELVECISHLVALLADEDEEDVPEEEKMTFHAQANVSVRVPHPPHYMAYN